MDGLEWKTLLKTDDLGVPPFSETSIWFNKDLLLPKDKISPQQYAEP